MKFMRKKPAQDVNKKPVQDEGIKSGILKDKIMDAIRQVAKEHRAILHEMRQPRHAPEYRYIFPDGTEIYIREGGAR